LALVWVLGLLVYWPAMGGPWLLDDSKLQEMREQEVAGGLSILGNGGWRAYVLLGGEGTGRPLAMITLLANGLFAQEPFAFKLTNLAFHLATASFVFVLVRTLFGVMGRERPDAAALVVTLIWTLHPLQVSTVAYVIQRMTILSALFSVWALLLYIRVRGGEIRDGASPRLLVWVSPLVVLPILALGAKENGALVPLFFLVAELALFRLRGSERTRRLLLVYFGIYFAALLVAALLILGTDFLATGFAHRSFTLGERLLTEPRVIMRYLGQILLPRLDDMIFFYDGIDPSRGIDSPRTTWVSIALLLGLVALGVTLIRRRPLAAFGLLLFLAGHAMESSFLPLELAFEHRNYLPSLGLILAATDLLLAGTAAVARYRRLVAVTAVAAVGILTLLRAEAWGDAEQIYATALRGKPPSLRARAELAQRYTDVGAIGEARRLLSEVDGAGPRLQTLYLDCLERGAVEPSGLGEVQARLARVIGDYEASGLIVLTNLALDGKCAIPKKELLSLLEAASAVPHLETSARQKLLMYCGHVYHALGEQEAAFDALERALGVDPRNPVPLLLAANWLLDLGETSRARSVYQRAVAPPVHPRLNLAPLIRELEERLRGKD
jgi:tetratricopeptide (TPR) repeat protein